MPGHKRRAGRCAARFDEILRQAQTLAGHLVNARCRRAAHFTPAIGPEVTVADVVGKNEYDVGFLLGFLRACLCGAEKGERANEYGGGACSPPMISRVWIPTQL